MIKEVKVNHWYWEKNVKLFVTDFEYDYDGEQCVRGDWYYHSGSENRKDVALSLAYVKSDCEEYYTEEGSYYDRVNTN